MASHSTQEHLGDPPLLPPQRGPDLFHLGDQLQPARPRRVGEELQVHQLHRLLRRPPPERVLPVRAAARRVPVHRGHQQLPAAAQGGDRLHQAARRQAQVRVPDVRRGDRDVCPRSWARTSGSPRPSCAAAWTTRSRPCASATRRACRRCRTCCPRSRATSTCAKVCEKAGIGHDLVLQSAFGDSGHTTFFIKSEADFRQPRARDHRRGRDQDHEADRLPRLGDRGLRHQARHHRRPADDRAGRLQGTDALSRRLVRQRDLRRPPSRPRSARRPATSPSSSASSCARKAIAATSSSTS